MPIAHDLPVDLQLLPVLSALLTHRNVTAAARLLQEGQPTVSRALGRLREQLGDPLLVRTGNRMMLTPRAEALREPLALALEQVSAALQPPPVFDPSTSQRSFRLATIDYGVATLVPRLLEVLAMQAPGVSLEVEHLGGDVDDALTRVELVLVPRRRAGPGVVWTRLSAESSVCAAKRGSLPRVLTLEVLCARPHVFVAPAGQRESVVDRALARRKRRRTVGLRLPSFLAAPSVVASTPYLAVLPRRLVRDDPRLDVRELPFTIPGYSIDLAWPERLRHDPAHAWLRRLWVSICATP